MIYRRLGRTDLKVSLLGLGSGGHGVLGQRKGVPEREIHKLIHRALALGINFFDTAPPPYYLESESILGRALEGIPRDRYLLSTKTPPIFRDVTRTDMRPREEFVESVENSLRNLKTEYIDLLLIAGCETGEAYDRVMPELLPTLQRFQQEGKVRYLGSTEASVSDGSHQWLARALQDDLLDAVMVAYNLLNHSAERVVFPLCRRKDVGVLGIYAVRNVFSQLDRLREVITDLKERGILAHNAVPDDDPLDWLVESEEDSLVSAAYRFVAGNDVVSSVMTGTINVEHLEQNVRATQKPKLPEEKTERLRQLFGHIAEPIGN